MVVAPGIVLEPSNVGKLHLTTPALAELIGARHREVETRGPGLSHHHCTMRAKLIGHFKACMTEIYLHIDARMADYIRTHSYSCTLYSIVQYV